MEGKTEQLVFNIEGLHCANCVLSVENALKPVKGIIQVDISLSTNSGIVSYNPSLVTPQKIFEVVKNSGYLPKEISGEDSSEKIFRNELILLVASIVLSVPFIPMMFGWHFISQDNILAIIATIVQFTVGLSFYRGAYYSLKSGTANMDVLVALGTTAAYMYSMLSAFVFGQEGGGTTAFWETAPILIVFIRTGKFLETRARGRAGSALKKLLTLQSDKARLLDDLSSTEKEVPASELQIGNIVLVKPGERIPVDGLIVNGVSALDESIITGESVPVKKAVDTEVYSGTINLTGVLKIKVTKPGKETVLSQIVNLVRQSQLEKVPIQRVTDRVAGHFVPIVFIISVVTLIIWLLLGKDLAFALSRAIAVLMISCPCALGLATPMAIMVGTGRGLAQGILFKRISVIETITKVNTVIFDKTGTLTEGKPVVTDIIIYPEESGKKISDIDFLSYAAGLATNSNHPFSQAIVEKANSEKVVINPLTDTEELSGEGVVTRDRRMVLGSTDLLAQHGIDIEPIKPDIEQLFTQGKSVVCLAREGTVLGIVGLTDKLRPTIKNAVNRLQNMGIKVVLLTGDKKFVAESVGKEINADEIIYEVLPTEKISVVKEFQSRGFNVAMVGDGINDAPALVQADLGIAVSSGTDIAKESGDIVLLRNDPEDIIKTLILGRATLRKIKQNLFWAFVYNVIGIPLAAGVFYPVSGWVLNPEFAGLAMAVSSISVVTNSWLLSRYN